MWAGLRFRAVLPGEWAMLVVSLKSTNAHCPGLHAGPCLAHMHDPAPESHRSDDTKAAKRAAHMAEWAKVVRQTFFDRHVLERHISHGGPLKERIGGLRADSLAARPLFQRRATEYEMLGRIGSQE